MNQKLRILVVFTISCYLIFRLYSATRSVSAFTATLAEIYHNRNSSYTDRMRLKYPRYYDYIAWIKIVTPEDAIIYQTDLEIPYGEPLWPSNNIQMNSAWLYPRRVVPWTGLDTVIKEDGRSTYMMVIDGFPRSDVIAKNVILFDQETKQIVGNYIHDNYSLTKLGLIEL